MRGLGLCVAPYHSSQKTPSQANNQANHKPQLISEVFATITLESITLRKSEPVLVPGEAPQKGNPYQLTRYQHLYPISLIKRFCTKDSSNQQTVQVQQRHARGLLRKSPKDKLFCAHREWDQRCEDLAAKDIEDPFARLVDEIEAGLQRLESSQYGLATRMYLLWHNRLHLKLNPVPDERLQGITGTQIEISKDDSERLEKAGTSVICSDDLEFKGRFIAPILLRRMEDDFLDLFQRRYNRTPAWDVLRSHQSEFIVPDKMYPCLAIPVSPTTALVETLMRDNGFNTERSVKRINSHARESYANYCFARRFKSCG